MSLDTIAYIKVFPGIGTARVGNSPDYFIGPEFPGDIPNLNKNYKDDNGLLKPQAAKFRVYGYDAEDNIVAEITHDPDNGISLEWDVHMRNLKAANYAFQGKFGFNPDQYRNPGVTPNAPGTDPNSRTSLIIDPGAKSISGITQQGASAIQLDGGKIFSGIGSAEIPSSLFNKGEEGTTTVTYTEKEVSLGRLETDDSGRLIVVGGKGDAGCLVEPPIILQKGSGNLYVQLGEAQPATPSTGPFPDAFYTNTIHLPLSSEVQQVLLAGKQDGSGDVYVDDKVLIKVNGTIIYSHDFSNGNSGKITPLAPIDITENIKPYLGNDVSITIEYVDLYPGSKGASEFWLVYTNIDPTSNGNSYFNNPGWYDDTSGGSINAKVTINGMVFNTGNDPKKRGWIAVSPPKYVPSMNNVVSLLDLQLDMFPEVDPTSGTLNFAILDSNGYPNIATGSSTLNFAPLSGVNTIGKSAPSIASFQEKDYLAYTGNNGNNLLAVSNDGGTTWTENQIGTSTTSHAPSICVFNDLLIYVVVGDSGHLNIGTSTDGSSFTFQQAKASEGSTPLLASSSPSVAAYNGSLYIAYTGQDNGLVIAQLGAIDEGKYTYTGFPEKSLAHVAPSIGVFFGELYYAYTGTDNKCYIGSYNNYSPAPTPPVIKFKFTQVGGSQTTTLAPAISGSHGKLYYALIGTDTNVYVAVGKPGFTDLSFVKQSNVTTHCAPAVANFSNLTFYRDIYPILKTVTDYAWVNEPAFIGHAPGSLGDLLLDKYINQSGPGETSSTHRTFVFRVIRPAEQLTPLVPPPPKAIPAGAIPDGGVQSGRLMPHLFGEGGSTSENTFNKTNFPNQWLSLTPHQLWKIQEWVNGNFKMGTKPSLTPSTKTFSSIPLKDQPAALNFSALEPTVGGGFHPGIELTYNMKEPGYFVEAFRFADNITDDEGNIIQAITPGSVSGYMSIPWQGDFWSCNISWWAAMRPDIVVTLDKKYDPPKLNKTPWFRGVAVGIPPNADNIPGYEGGYEHMVRYWSHFGFVVPTIDPTTSQPDTDLGMFVMGETERAACLDDADAPCTPVNPAEPVHLGVAQSARPSNPNLPHTFYTKSFNIIIPAANSVILSSNVDGTGNTFVDDKCVISINGNQVFSHDYSNGNSGRITPISPQDITDSVKPYTGKIVTITIEYIDLYQGSNSASDFWLTYK